MKKLISIVIPVYKSEAFLDSTLSTLFQELNLLNYTFEVILVNDGSPDDSWSVIKKWVEKEPRIKAFDLLKNYGQHNAILCGMSKSSGDYLITMDDDLQNPPKEIIKLIEKISEGYDLVFGKFPIKRHANYRKLGTKLINYLNTKIFKKPKNLVLSNFRIFTKEVNLRALHYKTNYPYIPGLLLMSARNMANILTFHSPRTVGKSNYGFVKIVKLMSNLLINYSSFPLKILTVFATIFSLLSFLIGAFIFVKALYNDSIIPGWASLMVMVSFMNALLILMIGTLGIYISRTVNHLTNVQPFIISESFES